MLDQEYVVAKNIKPRSSAQLSTQGRDLFRMASAELAYLYSDTCAWECVRLSHFHSLYLDTGIHDYTWQCTRTMEIRVMTKINRHLQAVM